MSTLTEITELRHKGQLKKALELARQMQREEPGEWANTCTFWVLRDIAQLLVQNPSPENIKATHAFIKEMRALLPRMRDDIDAGPMAILKLQKPITPHYDDIKQLSELSKSDPVSAYNQAVAIAGTDGKNLNSILHEDYGWIIYRYLKARLDELSSIKVRSLLRDYINLQNDRPSMLHSMILNFALNFARSHHDFLFPNFILLWGIDNLRNEDLRDGYDHGKTISSLISRICAQLSVSDNPLIDELSEHPGLNADKVVDMQRCHWFWILFDLQKNNSMPQFWHTINDYSARFGRYNATKWHSEIISLATRKVDEQYHCQFIEMMCSCSQAGMTADDFKPTKGTDDKEYPPIATQYAKKCYEIAKSQPQWRKNELLLDSLIVLYDDIESHNAGDEWTARQRAILSVWRGDQADAAARYRTLLRTLSDKYYIWQEMAHCTADLDTRIGLLLHALEIERNEDLIGPLRLQVADALIKGQHYTDAKTYLDAYIDHRQKQGKAPTDECRNLLSLCSGTTASQSFSPHNAIDKALDYAYSDIEWQEYVFIDRFEKDGKQKISFSDGTNSFITSAKRFGLNKKTKPGTVVKVKSVTIESHIKPLLLTITSQPLWSTLPTDCGYVSYVDNEKNSATLLTTGLNQCFLLCQSGQYKVGDFVRFHYYTKERNGEKRIEAVGPALSTRDECIHLFRQRIVAVDHVNPAKNLFHFTFGAHKIGDIVRFDQTTLRPAVGDLLLLTFCIRKNKEGKKHIVMLDIKTADQTDTSLVKEVIGTLDLIYRDGEWYDDDYHIPPDFGFVDDIYVPGPLLSANKIYDSCRIKGRAVVDSDGKWRLFQLEKI